MPLFDHLRELRYRVIVSALAITAGALVAAIFNKPVLDIAMAPGLAAKAAYEAANDNVVIDFTLTNVTEPFSLIIWVMVVAGLIMSCPVWLYQLWAYIAPALLKHEKKFALLFIGASVPLFLSGVALGYYVLPKGISVLLGFTPTGFGIRNLLNVPDFLSFELKMILIFGLSFLLPVVIVTLNLVGVVKSHQLRRARKGVIFGTVVFAAVATPSTDPFSMLALAAPMTLLYFVAELICRAIDKKRGITPESVADFAIDLDDGK